MWCCPAVSETTFVSEGTGIGKLRDVVVPSPSCPSELSPQQLTVWSGSTAHA